MCSSRPLLGVHTKYSWQALSTSVVVKESRKEPNPDILLTYRLRGFPRPCRAARMNQGLLIIGARKNEVQNLEVARLLLSGLETGRKDLAKGQKRCDKDAISIYKMFGHRLSRKVSYCCSKSVQKRSSIT